jgi:uridine kinase
MRQTEMEIDLNKKPLFIGVAGGTASGKTSVCEM